MSFAYPLVFFAPLFIAISALLRRKFHTQPVPVSSSSLTEGIARSPRLILRTPVLSLLAAIALSSLTIAAARPQRLSEIPKSIDARNLIMALDLSRSMETRDFNIDGKRANRLDGVKSVVADLLKERSADRIGLVVFGVRALLQSPLTFDHALIQQMVGNLQCGVAGDGTAIGDGLGLAIKRLQKKTSGTRAIVLITDGVNNSGNVNPLKAANIAKDLGIKVHTIGIGSSDNIPVDNRMLGRIFNPLAGKAEFDEKLLKEIAQITGAKYSAAGSSEDLRQIYSEIEKLDRAEEDSFAAREVEELYLPFALAALASYVALLLLSRTYFLKVPSL